MPAAQAESNKETVRRFHDVMNSGGAEGVAKAVDEFVAADAVIRTPLPTGATGAEALKVVFGTLYQAFPDLHVAIDDLIAEDDKVVSRNTVTGTHHGELLGRPPTGKSISYNEVFIFRLADGRITETWGVVDTLTVMRQIGAIP